MRRFLSSLAIFLIVAQAQTPANDVAIPAGVVAAHMVGRMVIGADGAAELIGYYPFLEGIEGSPFSSEPDASERTARFTFRSSRFRVSILRNDPLTHLRATPVEANTPSDPYLFTGYDKKTLTLSHTETKPIEVNVEVDLTGFGLWVTYQRFTVQPGKPTTHTFPTGFNAYWLRTTSNQPATLTAQLRYA